MEDPQIVNISKNDDEPNSSTLKEDKKVQKTKIKKKSKQKQSKFAIWWRWPLIVLVASFLLSFTFSLGSEVLLSDANIILSVAVIVIFLVLSIIGDMIGVAVTAGTLEPFRAMASRKIRGANESIMLVKNADKVASIFADILGDICGILSGAAGASVSTVIITDRVVGFMGVFIASLVSAVIAALIIFGKALFKKYSIKHCEKIILIVGKFLSIFHKQPGKAKKNKNDKKKDKIKIEENNIDN